MFNRSDENGHLCLVPDFKRKAFSFSLLSIMSAVGLSWMGFIKLSCAHSVPPLIRVFFFLNHECMLVLSNALSIEMAYNNFYLFFVSVVNYIHWFVDIESFFPSLGISGISPTWLWCLIPFYIFLNSVHQYFFELFSICIH